MGAPAEVSGRLPAAASAFGGKVPPGTGRSSPGRIAGENAGAMNEF